MKYSKTNLWPWNWMAPGAFGKVHSQVKSQMKQGQNEKWKKIIVKIQGGRYEFVCRPGLVSFYPFIRIPFMPSDQRSRILSLASLFFSIRSSLCIASSVECRCRKTFNFSLPSLSASWSTWVISVTSRFGRTDTCRICWQKGSPCCVALTWNESRVVIIPWIQQIPRINNKVASVEVWK